MFRTLRMLAVCVLTITLLGSPGNSVMADSPDMPPSIMNLYHKNPDLLKPINPMNQVTESEMVSVKFNQDWLSKNDLNPNPYTVTITFPAEWVQGYSAVNDLGSIVLSIPRQLLMDHNVSKSEGEISVTLPNDYFKGLPTPPTSPPDLMDVSQTKGGYSTDAIEYVQRIKYVPSAGTSIIGAYGRVVPNTTYNPSSETFLAYQEIENGGTGGGNDWIEVVMEYSYSPSRTRIWFAYFDNSTSNFTQTGSLDVSVGDEILYEWAIVGSHYHVWFYKNGTFYNSTIEDTTLPTSFYYFGGSSEFDTRGGLNGNTVNTVTWPLSIENLGYAGAGWQSGPSTVNSRLSYDSTSPDDQYVYLTHFKDATNGLRFYTAGGSAY